MNQSYQKRDQSKVNFTKGGLLNVTGVTETDHSALTGFDSRFFASTSPVFSPQIANEIMDENLLTLLNDWLHNCKNHKRLNDDVDIVEAIYSIIEDWRNHKDLTNALCVQLFGFYRSGDATQKAFSLQFIPSLMFTYLNGIAQGHKLGVGCIQTLLLAIYNLEAGEEPLKPKTQSFRVANLAQPSIYHEPLGLAPSALTESALKKLDPANRITVKLGPHPHLLGFNAENRLTAMAALFNIYMEHLSMYSSASLIESCLAFTRLVTLGYRSQTEESPRIPLSSQILVQILRIIYSLTFYHGIDDVELSARAQQALEAVQNRIEVELMPAPLLMSSAFAHSSSLSVKGVASTSQLVSSANTAGARTQWKSMITNASFRTKKLPDDIVVPAAAVTLVAPASASSATASLPSTASTSTISRADTLGAITEENDETTTISSTKSFRLPELSNLVKKKDKNKKKDSNAAMMLTSPNSTVGGVDAKDDLELQRRGMDSVYSSTQV